MWSKSSLEDSRAERFLRQIVLQRVIKADVVYGSRFLGGPHRVLLFWHYVGNRLLTILSNMFTDLNPSNVWTCHKGFRREVVQKLTRERPHLRRGQEDHLEGRAARLLVRRALRFASQADGKDHRAYRSKEKQRSVCAPTGPLPLCRNHHQHPAISSSAAVDVPGHGNRHKG